METWGIISDAEVHFTPEYFNSLRWEKRGDKIFLQYFSGAQRIVEIAIIQLIGAHIMMLKVLNDCLEGAFAKNQEWRKTYKELHIKTKPWADKLDEVPESTNGSSKAAETPSTD